MSTDKVIFVGEQWGVTGSNMTGSDVTGSHVTGRDHVRNRKYDMRMRNWKFRNTPSGTFSSEVTSVTGSDSVSMRNRYILYYYQSSSASTWLSKGWKGVRIPTGSCPRSSLVGPFHRNLATGSAVIFPRIFLSGSAKCWLGCSLRRPRLPLSLVICPLYLHNYIYSLFFSDMLCSTPRMVFLIKVKWMKCVIFS